MCLNQGGGDVWEGHAPYRKHEKYIFLSENPKGKYHLIDLGVDRRIKMKRILKK
jgi:hypothetical protein